MARKSRCNTERQYNDMDIKILKIYEKPKMQLIQVELSLLSGSRKPDDDDDPGHGGSGGGIPFPGGGGGIIIPPGIPGSGSDDSDEDEYNGSFDR